LDSMAGTGIVGRRMQELFGKLNVTYHDKSKKMLLSDKHKGHQRIMADATALSIADDSFDIIFCHAGLNNVNCGDYLKIFKEYIRVLRNNGVIIFQDHFAHIP